MSTTLAALVARLTLTVPAVNSVPTTTQYEQCCEDAVADLSRRKPLQKLATLSIVAGTATYSLPTDFIRLASLEGVGRNGGNTLVTSQGLVAFGTDFVETYAIRGQTIVFSPTPAYTVQRRLWYAAAHVLDETETYADLTPEDAQLALLKAAALAWDVRAAALVASAYSFTIGQWSENHGPQVQLLQKQSETLTQQYETAVKQAVGPLGTRGRGNVWYAPRSWEDAA